MNDDFKDYYGKEVTLIVDGRGYDTRNYSSNANVSLQLEAIVTGESEKLLNLKNIFCKNTGILTDENEEDEEDEKKESKYYMGSINKTYVIGIFLASGSK